MKKIAIITLQGCNYGNRLQNYAVQQKYKNYNADVYTLKNIALFNSRNHRIVKSIKLCFSFIKSEIKRDGVYRFTNSKGTKKREKKFIDFNRKFITFSKEIFSFRKNYNYDLYIVGSDQVWNPYFGLKDLGLLNFDMQNSKKISFSASIGVDEIPIPLKKKFANAIKNFDYISVREDKAKEIINSLGIEKDINVLVDPTMLLTADEWDKVSRKPKQLDNVTEKKYILNYFLGKLSETRKKEIERIARENNCHIINILDKKDPFYVSGPSEFLYLEKNAFLICTDSFHSSVFAILYNRPFIVFDREDNVEKMNSRIDTLLKKFQLENRKYNGKNITKGNLEHDYNQAYIILDKERKKSEDFIKKTLGIK